MANYNSLPLCDHNSYITPPPYNSLNSASCNAHNDIPLTYVDFVPKRLDEGGAFTTKEFERFE